MKKGQHFFLGTVFYRFIVLFALCLPCISNAQELVFCEKVAANGTPTNYSSHFAISSKGGTVQLLVKAPKILDCNNATVDVFMADEKYHEVFENTIKVSVQPTWSWFTQSLSFYKAGTYVVYAYDEFGRLLGTARVNISITR